MSSSQGWFVYRAECAPLGPLKMEEIADAILAGRLPPDAWIAPAGGSGWRSAIDVPDIARLVDGMPTRRHESGMLLRTTRSEPPPDTVSPITAEEGAPTERTPPVRGPDGFPVPSPPSSMATPSPAPYVGGGDTLESIEAPGSSRKAGGL